MTQISLISFHFDCFLITTDVALSFIAFCRFILGIILLEIFSFDYGITSEVQQEEVLEVLECAVKDHQRQDPTGDSHHLVLF